MRPTFAALLIALTVFSTACDDPTSVGVELIDNRSGAPEVEQIGAALIENRTVFDVTGNSRRALMGQVEDPLVGGTAASAALDFALPASLVPSAAFRQGPVTYAELRLRPDYRYGDTTATVDVNVAEIFEDWSATGNNSSEVITSGPVLLTTTLDAADTLFTIPLPESWINDKDPDLRSQDFVNLFNGFLVEAISEGVLLGIDIDRSGMMVVSGDDTVSSFLVSRNLSLVRRTTAGAPPTSRAILQDGHGAGLGIDLNLEASDFQDVALSRIVVRVPYDSLAFDSNLPVNFVRPSLPRVDLVGITPDSLAIPLATSQVRNGVLIFEDPVLRSTIQDLLIGQSVFDSFALMGSLDSPPIDNTASALLLMDGSIDPEDGPIAALTVIRPAEL